MFRSFVLVVFAIASFLTCAAGNTAKPPKIYEVQRSWNTAFQASVQFKVKQKTPAGWSLKFEFLGQLQRLEFEFNGWFPAGAVDPKPPPVIIFFQRARIFRSVSIRAPSTTRAGPTVPTTTTDIVFVLTKYLNSKQQGSASQTGDQNQPKGNSDNLFDLLDNQFSPVEPLGEGDKLPGHQNFNLNEIINQQNAEANRINDIRNALNATVGYNATDVNIFEGSSDGGENFTVENFTSKPQLQSTGPTSTLPPILTSKYDYKSVIHKSLLFYEAQRSGSLPLNKRLDWTESSALKDRGKSGEDLTGGYYDAGDYTKFGFPMAFSVTMLAWGVIEYWDVYKSIGELQNALEALKWGSDYFLKAHISAYELYGQVAKYQKYKNVPIHTDYKFKNQKTMLKVFAPEGVGDPVSEHKSWGRPDTIPPRRPAYSINKKNPGSDLAGETAAALAAVSLALRRAALGETTEYISELVRHANELFIFGRNFRRKYDQSIKKAQDYYPSTSFKDELVWAAAWLYRATGEKDYLEWAEGQYQNWALFVLPKNMKFSWDDKRVGVQILLAQVSSVFKRRYESAITSYCNELRSNKTYKTPKGLMYLGEWSPLRYSANSAFACLMAADYGINKGENVLFSQKQIDYMLGDSGRSYLVGFGENYPKNVHHRASSCPKKPRQCGWQEYQSGAPNPIVLEGALVGGPNQKDNFEDSRKNVKQSEVALDYNAGFQGAVAALQYQLMYPNRNISREHEPWYANYLKDTVKDDKPNDTGSSSRLRASFISWTTILVLCTLMVFN